ncbi:hypothetical protein [Candidatus Anaplasma sp. TIGMIC]|uniref:hypothetical protein n=1 Tax=Candidatus Anaplasma sp. TIGMIC TaxID=3020713 RepID=UPI00232BC092|nr:hypothetical protein [Candidatus Anaplasma sp. TIGMIC]
MFAVLFDKICASVDDSSLSELPAVPSHDEITQNPSVFCEFLVARAQSTKTLGAAPYGLFRALAKVYLTPDYENELEDVSSFIRTCFVKIPPNTKVVPVADSCKISGIRYIEPGARSVGANVSSNGILVVEEQRDFEIKNESGNDIEDGVRLRLVVEYKISAYEKRTSLYSIKTLRVVATLINSALNAPVAKTCRWSAAHGRIREFNVTTFGIHQGGMHSSVSIHRIQPGNAGHLTRRVFANTGSSGGFVRCLLGALLDMPCDKVRLSYGRTQVHEIGESMYSVRRRVLARNEWGGVICGADVKYEVCGHSRRKKVYLHIHNVHIVNLQHTNVAEHIRFLHGDCFMTPPAASYWLMLNCGVIFFDFCMLDDAKKLAAYNGKLLGYTIPAYRANGGELALG